MFLPKSVRACFVSASVCCSQFVFLPKSVVAVCVSA